MASSFVGESIPVVDRETGRLYGVLTEATCFSSICRCRRASLILSVPRGASAHINLHIQICSKVIEQIMPLQESIEGGKVFLGE